MRRLVLAALTAAIAATTLVGTPGSAHAASTTCSVLVAGHRGSHDATHTENTLRSTTNAVAKHADLLEGDMQLTKDGVWVLIHDSTLDRTTNGRGAIAALTLAQVKAARTDDGVLGGVPTVEQTLDTLDSATTTGLQLEIKPANVSTTNIKKLLAMFAAHGVAKRLVITSFHEAPLKIVRGYSASWRTGLISTSAVTAKAAAPFGTTVIIEQAALNATYVRQMRGAGFAVFAWTVDSQAGFDKVVATGVNGVVTNRITTTFNWCAA